MRHSNDGKPKASSRSEESRHKEIAQIHLGIIVSRVAAYWKYLPQTVRNFYDLEDMVSDCVLHVIRVSHRYDPNKAKSSTWVWHVANHYCEDLRDHFQTQQYVSFEYSVQLDQPVLGDDSEQNRELPAPTDTRRVSFDAVEKVIEYGSDELLELLNDIFYRGINIRKIPEYLANEFRRLADQHSADYDDFIAVYRAVA